MFNRKWLIQSPWLQTSDPGLFCNPCSLASKSLVKILVVKLSNLKQHEQIRKHAEAIESYCGGDFVAAAGETTRALIQACERPPQKAPPVCIEEKGKKLL